MLTNAARRIHGDLVNALDRLRVAEQSAVVLFARVWREELYRSLGHATIELYGTEGLGLSTARTRQFLRLARALDDLPATREALASGDLPWTKARTIVAVATPRTEERWVAAARCATSRELETKVSRARQRGKRERERLRRSRGQGAMVLPGPVDPPMDHPAEPIEPTEFPVSVTLDLSPVDHARFEAAMECLRKRGRRDSRAALVLEGLSALTAESGGPRGSSATPFQVVAYRCDDCNKAAVGTRPVSRTTAAAMMCDAVLTTPAPAQTNRRTIPPSTRRAVLTRDQHRCTTAGCDATHYLEVHHIVPRSRGGSNGADNLTTLCAACHRFHHERDPT